MFTNLRLRRLQLIHLNHPDQMNRDISAATLTSSGPGVKPWLISSCVVASGVCRSHEDDPATAELRTSIVGIDQVVMTGVWVQAAAAAGC